MADLSTHNGDLYINGVFTAKTMNIPAAAISRNDQVSTVADPIKATNLQQRHIKTVALSDHATDAAAKRVVIHVCQGVGTIVSFKAGVTVAATSTGAAVVDLKVNGNTRLTGTITLDSGNAVFTQESAPGFTSVDLVAGDVVEASINSVTGSTLPKGVNATAVIDENP